MPDPIHSENAGGAPLVEIRDLTRDYRGGSLFGSGHRSRAVDRVSLDLWPGEILGVVGESGCGKSTLARLVMALDRPTGGEVRFEGVDLFSLDEAALRRRRAAIQMVFQDPFGSLNPRHRVGRIVAEPLHLLAPRLGRAEERARVAEMLASVGLQPGHADRYPHEFSGGQRQRIAIARALITAPKLVVADEAVSALDLSVQAQVLNLLMDLRQSRGVTFLFITHNLAVVDCIADRVAVMYRGRIVETGPAQSVLERPLHPYTRVLAEAEPSVSRFGRPRRTGDIQPQVGDAVAGDRGAGDGSADDGWIGGCAFRRRCPLAIPRCDREVPALTLRDGGRLAACHRAGEAGPG